MLRLNTELRTLESYLIYPSPGQEGYFLLGHDYMVNETSLYYLRFPFCLELSEQRPVCWHSPEGGVKAEGRADLQPQALQYPPTEQ